MPRVSSRHSCGRRKSAGNPATRSLRAGSFASLPYDRFANATSEATCANFAQRHLQAVPSLMFRRMPCAVKMPPGKTPIGAFLGAVPYTLFVERGSIISLRRWLAGGLCAYSLLLAVSAVSRDFSCLPGLAS